MYLLVKVGFMHKTRRNLFDGDSYYALFAQETYNRMISRKWFAYIDVMVDHLGLKSSTELTCNVSNCDNYGELKKAFRDVCNAIKYKVGDDCIEEKGNNRNKCFRYIGKDNDPLADMKNAKVINNLRQYWKFCQDSAGFFPASWLDYYFKDCQDLLDIKSKKRKGEQVISVSLDRILTNIEYLPSLYEAITNKTMLEIDYKPFDEEEVTLMFHPHYLKEYNGRWHLFGHAEGKEPEYGFNIALDRIQSKPRERSKLEYVPAPKLFYDELFKNIVGVSHMKEAEQEHIVIRARSLYIYKLMDTKPIHQSYTVIKPFFRYDDGEYAEFSVDIEPNNEFYGRILQMGAGLEIISPDSVRDEIAKRVQNLADLYPKKE